MGKKKCPPSSVLNFAIYVPSMKQTKDKRTMEDGLEMDLKTNKSWTAAQTYIK